jgi:hypothetical protein
MNQQMHNWTTIYYTILHYTAPTFLDAIVSSSGSSKSVPDKLHKYMNAVLVMLLNFIYVLLLIFKIIKILKLF